VVTLRVLLPARFELSPGLHTVVHQMFQDRPGVKHLSILDVLKNLPHESKMTLEAQRLFEGHGEFFWVRTGLVEWV